MERSRERAELAKAWNLLDPLGKGEFRFYNKIWFCVPYSHMSLWKILGVFPRPNGITWNLKRTWIHHLTSYQEGELKSFCNVPGVFQRANGITWNSKWTWAQHLTSHQEGELKSLSNVTGVLQRPNGITWNSKTTWTGYLTSYQEGEIKVSEMFLGHYRKQMALPGIQRAIQS